VTEAEFFDAARRLKRELTGAGLTQAEVDAFRKVIAAWNVTPAKLAHPETFFSHIRASLGALTQDQVDGFNAVLSVVGDERWPLAWAAYGLATAYWETNKTMEPVREAYWKTEEWRKANLARYYPYYGRGYVQLTWKFNYEKADEELQTGGALAKEPDLALNPTIAAAVMAKGMAKGWFTTKSLATYLPAAGRATPAQYKEARRIINGQDKATEIAGIAKIMENALVAGGWG
jgi:hypothetical protein